MCAPGQTYTLPDPEGLGLFVVDQPEPGPEAQGTFGPVGPPRTQAWERVRPRVGALGCLSPKYDRHYASWVFSKGTEFDLGTTLCPTFCLGSL